MFKDVLTEEEITNITNLYKYKNDQTQHILSLYLQKYMIKKHFDLEYNTIKIKKNEFGKPYFENTKGFEFNISHDKDYVIGVCGYSKIGVDILNINNKMNIQIFNKLDKNFINIINENPHFNMIKMWSLIESYFKAIGIGMRYDFNNLLINNKTIQYLDYDILNYKHIIFKDFLICICFDQL